MAKCIICKSRKGKRNCPAVSDVVCSQCCGVKKVTELDCPIDCFYLKRSIQYFTDRQNTQKVSHFDREMNTIISHEEPYIDILQNIEFMIFNCYKQNDNICDEDVRIALEYLMEMGKAQLDLPSKFLIELPENVQSIVEVINDVLEFRESFGKKEDLITRLKCIYRVLDSVKTHYKPENKYNYLEFISTFLC